MDVLKHIDYLSFTSDGWKNISQNCNYRDLSCHGILWVKGKMILVSFLLGIQPLAFKDAKRVSTWISDILDSYEIPLAKRGVMTADGAEEAAARDAHLEYWWCIAHWINLAVHDAIKHSDFIQEELDRVKKLVTAIRQSAHLQAELDSIAKSHVTLKQDVETRWSSEYLMLSSVLNNIVPLRKLFELHQDLRIAQAGLDLLQDIRAILAVAYDATTFMQHQRKITAIEAWKVVWSCVSAWRKHVPVKTPAGEAFKEAIINSWKTRANTNFRKSEAAQLCFFLNPSIWGSKLVDGKLVVAAQRFYEENEMDKIPGGVYSPTADAFLRSLQQLAERATILYGSKEELEPPTQEQEPSQKTSQSALFQSLNDFESSACGAFDVADPKAEIFYFIKNRTYERGGTLLDYYASKQSTFPSVVRMATRYLCIPAASIASESLWSLAGNASEDERALTSPEHLENQMLIRRNHAEIAGALKLLEEDKK